MSSATYEKKLVSECDVCKVPLTSDNDHNDACLWYSEEDGRSPFNFREYIKNRAKKAFSKENLLRRFPVCKWLQKYSLEDLTGDALAGFTVGLTVIPQGIAYAIVAGLPPNYGLYSAFLGCFLYVIFGSCKDITIGPTAIMCIMVHQYSMEGNPEVTVLLTFLSGIIILFLNLFDLGFVVTFVSKPVICAFTSAAAITIASSQIKGLLGIRFKAEGNIDTWTKVVKHIHEARMPDLVLGLSSIAVLLFAKKMKDFKIFKADPQDSMAQVRMKKVIHVLSLGSNAIVVLTASCIAASLDANQPFSITGEVKGGLPSLAFPSFSTNGGNTTFLEICSSYGSGLILVPLVAVLESIAIGTAFSHGKALDASQEILALGMCNLLGAFVQSIPVTGSFSRTAVNYTSGVRTPGSGIVTGTLVLLALAVLTPYFRFIPKSALAAVIITAVIFMVEYHDIIPIWKVRRPDHIVLFATFLSCLLWKLEFGILVGVAVNVSILLYDLASPKVVIVPYLEDEILPKHISVEARSGLFFPAVSRFRSIVTKAAIEEGLGIHPVVVYCHHFSGIDYTGSKGIQTLIEDFEKRKQLLIFVDSSPGVRRGIKALSPCALVIRREKLFTVLSHGGLPLPLEKLQGSVTMESEQR